MIGGFKGVDDSFVTPARTGRRLQFVRRDAAGLEVTRGNMNCFHGLPFNTTYCCREEVVRECWPDDSVYWRHLRDVCCAPHWDWVVPDVAQKGNTGECCTPDFQWMPQREQLGLPERFLWVLAHFRAVPVLRQARDGGRFAFQMNALGSYQVHKDVTQCPATVLLDMGRLLRSSDVRASYMNHGLVQVARFFLALWVAVPQKCLFSKNSTEKASDLELLFSEVMLNMDLWEEEKLSRSASGLPWVQLPESPYSSPLSADYAAAFGKYYLEVDWMLRMADSRKNAANIFAGAARHPETVHSFPGKPGLPLDQVQPLTFHPHDVDLCVELRKLLSAPGPQLGGMLRVLHVGSGFFMPERLGCGAELDGMVRLMHADKMARGFLGLYAAHGIDQKNPAYPCGFEDLHHCFPAGYFALVFAKNALDHATDPARGLEELVRTARRPGGLVILQHFRNEGAASAFQDGLHRWALDAVWTPGNAVSVSPSASEANANSAGGRYHLVVWNYDIRLDATEWLEQRLPGVAVDTQLGFRFGYFETIQVRIKVS